MSNVLIGIIGVILFIGLALAGALILGDDFRSANSDSKAAAIVQQFKQMDNAIDMYRLKTGQPYDPSFYPSNLMPRFLKAAPVIPGGAAVIWRTAAVGPDMVLVATSNMSTATGNASKQICEAVVLQTTGATSVPTEPVSDVGCYYNGVRYLAYLKVVL